MDWASLGSGDEQPQQSEGPVKGPVSWDVVDVPVEMPDAAEADSPPHYGRWVAAGCVALVAVIGGGVVYLSSWSRGSSADEDEQPGVEAAPAVTTEVSTQSAPGPECEEVAADPGDRQGVVVAFQQAYYSGDVAGVEELLADSSPLVATDWPEVLAEASGKSVCTVTRMRGDEVEADVAVQGDEGRRVYRQAYALEQAGEDWRIITISDRSKK